MEGQSPTSVGDGDSRERVDIIYMSKGDEDDSYSKNSEVQNWVIERAVIPHLNEALARFHLPANDNPVVLADLGCSSGPNAIRLMSHTVEKIKERLASSDGSSLEFQAFFNDLPSNDFNNFFHILSSGDVKSSSFFSAGVPGSFFDRLFPQSAIHVFISTIALHYLSKLPASVVDKESAAFNKGTWWAVGSGSNKAAANAFKEQHAKDIDTFLSVRAKELVPGGLLCFAMLSRWNPESSTVETSIEASGRCVDNALKELSNRGVIDENVTDLFNVPMYFPTTGELKDLMPKHHANFEVLAIEEIRLKPFVEDNPGHDRENSLQVSRTATNFIKGAFAGIARRQYGEEATKLLFEYMEKEATANVAELSRESPVAFVALKKK